MTTQTATLLDGNRIAAQIILQAYLDQAGTDPSAS